MNKKLPQSLARDMYTHTNNFYCFSLRFLSYALSSYFILLIRDETTNWFQKYSLQRILSGIDLRYIEKNRSKIDSCLSLDAKIAFKLITF